MNLSVIISGQKPNEVKVAIKQHNTGSNADTPESRQLHAKVCEYLEPAVYEAIKALVNKGILTRAVVLWDGNTFNIKSK